MTPVVATIIIGVATLLSAAEQKILQEAAIEARDYQRQVSREQAQKAVASYQLTPTRGWFGA